MKIFLKWNNLRIKSFFNNNFLGRDLSVLSIFSFNSRLYLVFGVTNSKMHMNSYVICWTDFIQNSYVFYQGTWIFCNSKTCHHTHGGKTKGCKMPKQNLISSKNSWSWFLALKWLFSSELYGIRKWYHSHQLFGIWFFGYGELFVFFHLEAYKNLENTFWRLFYLFFQAVK